MDYYIDRHKTNKNKKVVFTDDMKRHLKANYCAMSIEELAEYYNLSVTQVKNQANRQLLTKRGK